MRRRLARPIAGRAEFIPTETELADAAALLAVLKALPRERRMDAVALTIRVWLDGNLDSKGRKE